MGGFNPYQLLFIIPGFALAIISLYVPLNYLRKQLSWTETEAIIVERTEFDNGGEADIRYRLQFTDTLEAVYHFLPNSEDMEGKDSDHVRIYYDPTNPSDAELVNPGHYLVILFFPFGLLLAYLGWSQKNSREENQSRRSIPMNDPLKAKILNALLIATSLFGYLEWGKDNHSFLFQAEGEIIRRLISDPGSVIHPFTLLPLFGQILLLITLFQKTPNKILTYLGVIGIGVLLALMFVIGLMSSNLKILLSTLPFLVVAFLTIRRLKKNKKVS